MPIDRRTMMAVTASALAAPALSRLREPILQDRGGTQGDPSANVMAIGLFIGAASLSMPVGTDVVQTSGHTTKGLGIAKYVSDPAVDAAYVASYPRSSFVSANGRGFRIVGDLDITMFGARGTGDETLYATNYVVSLPGSLKARIARQTRDGLAINEAIRLLRARGGGSLKIPKGDFTAYGYLERIDFPVRIHGEGRGVSRLRNVAASPWAHGYGILALRPSSLAEISIESLTLSGHGLSRRGSGEMHAYPLWVGGYPQLTVRDVKIVDSIIDCMTTVYVNGETGAYVQVSDSYFSNAYRCTFSCIAGWNQQYTNCIFEKGGMLGTGTAPRAVLDIEPNASTATIKNLTFNGCTFREARTSIVDGTWCGRVHFANCRFEAKGGDGVTTGISTALVPYMAYVRAGQFLFSNCTFEETAGNYAACFAYTQDVTSGEYATSGYCKLVGCQFSGCGVQSYGNLLQVNNVTIRNSLIGFFCGGNLTQNLVVKGLTLINVFDARSPGSGSLSSFGIAGLEGYADISDVQIRVDTGKFPPGLKRAMAAIRQQFGMNIGASVTGKVKLSGVQVQGFARELPTLLGKAPDSTKFRDWRTPFCRNCTE